MTEPMTPTTLAADAAHALQVLPSVLRALFIADWNLRFSARDPETGDDLYPGSFVHLAVEDANQAAAALTALSEQNAALTAQGAELTKERDEALSAARQQDKLREATLATLRGVSAEFEAAEAKLALLEGVTTQAVKTAITKRDRNMTFSAAWVLAREVVAELSRAALTEGDTTNE
jgi:hypothetical protein